MLGQAVNAVRTSSIVRRFSLHARSFIVGTFLGGEYWQKRKSVFELTLQKHEIANHPRLDEYVGDTAVTFKGPAMFVKMRDAPIKAHITAAMRPWRKPKPEYPAIVTHQFGKGRVVYIPAGIDAAYYLYPYPYQRILLAQSIRWAAATAPPIEVEAPMCVHATCFRQATQGERLVVHLYNDINTTGNHALPDEDVPLREEVLPIHDLRVTFRPDYQITRAHLEPGNIDLKINRAAAGSSVTVQRLGVHCMVIAELE